MISLVSSRKQNILCEYPLITAARPVARVKSSHYRDCHHGDAGIASSAGRLARELSRARAVPGHCIVSSLRLGTVAA